MNVAELYSRALPFLVRVTAILQDEFDCQVFKTTADMGRGRICIVRVFRDLEHRSRCVKREINWFRAFYPPNIE